MSAEKRDDERQSAQNSLHDSLNLTSMRDERIPDPTEKLMENGGRTTNSTQKVILTKPQKTSFMHIENACCCCRMKDLLPFKDSTKIDGNKRTKIEQIKI